MLTSITYIQIAWRYPLSEVTPALDECKSRHRSQLDHKCKVKLPIVKPIQYDSISSQSETRNIITMLYGASYTNQRDYASGGSPGIDIATAKGTPVYSIGDGVVVYAGVRAGGDGNSISIAHNDAGKTIYSHYSHLDSIEVKKNQKVQAGTYIGTVGNSGRTIGKYGNHLDFQIDIRDTYSKMFGYYGCKDGYIGAINNGTCRDMMTTYTVDPLKFLADRNAILPTPSTTSLVSTSANPSTPVNPVSLVAPVVVEKKSQTPDLLKTNTKSDPATHQATTLKTIINGLTYQIDGLYPQTVMSVKQKLTVKIQVTDAEGKPYKGILSDTIDIITANRNITSTIETINYVDDKVELTLTAKKPGSTSILIKAGDYTLAQIPFVIK